MSIKIPISGISLNEYNYSINKQGTIIISIQSNLASNKCWAYHPLSN